MSDRRACYFFDTSALAKLLVRERGSDRVRALHDAGAPHVLATTRLACVELASALHRRARAGELSAEAASTASHFTLNMIETRYQLQDVTASLASAAIDLIARHRLTPVDALHLAASLRLAQSRPDLAVTLISSDAALNQAAAALAFPFEDPAS